MREILHRVQKQSEVLQKKTNLQIVLSLLLLWSKTQKTNSQAVNHILIND